MNRAVLFALVCAAAAAAACENGVPWADRPERAVRAPADFGPTAAYERRLVFMGPGQRLPTAAVLDFVTLSDSVGVHRTARGHTTDGSEWIPVLDHRWEMERMRDPWRLTPSGPLALLVGDGGDLAAVVVRAEPVVRVEPGPILAEHSPDAGTRLVLQQARLTVGVERVQGIMLDAQLGRAVEPIDRNGRVDVARAGTEAVLMDYSGYYVVFVASAADRFAWIHHAGRDDVRRGAGLAPVDESDDAGMPMTWRIASGTELSGELVAETSDWVAPGAADDEATPGYAIVTGWIQDRGVRRDVVGLVRHLR